MIQIINNDIKRGGEKIGWIDGNHIFDHTGKKIGYFEGTDVFNVMGVKLGYMDGEYIKIPNNPTKIRIEDNLKEVTGVVPDLTRAAVRLLLG